MLCLLYPFLLYLNKGKKLSVIHPLSFFIWGVVVVGVNGCVHVCVFTCLQFACIAALVSKLVSLF